MKKSLIYRIPVLLFTIFFVSAGKMAVYAQDNVTNLDKEEVSSWFSQNWSWVVAGAVILLLIIIAASSRKTSTRTSTTIIKDEQGKVKKMTTTEVTE